MFRNQFRNSLLTAAAAVAILGAGSAANAQLISGTLPLVGFGVSDSGALLSSSSVISSAFTLVSTVGTGDYNSIPLGAVYTDTPLNFTTPTSWTISNGTYGSFMASTFTVVTLTNTFYNVELFGLYSGLPGYAPTPTEANISVNAASTGGGVSYSEAITLSSPPASIPEPGNVAMLTGMGLSGVGFLARRRRK
jgi:hypothetical protein